MMQMMEDDDGVSTGMGAAALPSFDGGESIVLNDTSEQHELLVSYRFYFIQDSEDEDGHTNGKV